MEATDSSVVLTLVAAGSLGPPVSLPSLAIICTLRPEVSRVVRIIIDSNLPTHHSRTNVCQQIMHVAIFGVLCVCACVGILYMGRRLSSLSSSSSSVSAPKLGSFCRRASRQQSQDGQCTSTIDTLDTFLRRTSPSSTHAGLTYSGTGFRRLLQTKLQPSYKSEEYDQQIMSHQCMY